jgi:flagellar hook-associated protein 1 FlgK
MSLLSIASTGLNASQRALDMIGNNITNANTKGYSRQSIQLMPSLTQRYGNSFIGSGVSIQSIDRVADQFANHQLTTSTSIKSLHDSFFQQASQIDKLLSQDGVGLSAPLQNFFTALGQLNSNPADAAVRDVALKQSQLLTGQFNYLQDRLTQYQTNSKTQITEAVNQVNRLATDLASVNKSILTNPASPDLLDQRDLIVNQMAEFTDINAFYNGNGTVDVSFGSSEMLVIGTSTYALSVGSSTSREFTTQIISSHGSDVSSRFRGGIIRGQLDFEQDVIGTASKLIGQMAIGLATKFNSQQQLGLDLNDNIGSNFFTDFNGGNLPLLRSQAFAANTGNAVFSVTIDPTNIASLTPSDYELSYDAATLQYTLTRKSDNSSVVPYVLGSVQDGVSISLVAGAIAGGDTFSITPTRGAAAYMQTELVDIKNIALAAPIRTIPGVPNYGSGTIKLAAVNDTTTDPALFSNTNTITINTTTSPGAFTIAFGDGRPSVVGQYTPGANNTVYFPDPTYTPGPPPVGTAPAFSVTISGIPMAGDVFNVDPNTGAKGDNFNGIQLTALREANFFNGGVGNNGTQSITDLYASLVSSVGSDTNQSKLRASSADIIFKQAADFQSSKSGVNIDEEASNLIRYRQSYEASGKLMQVANEVMSILFDLMR